ncbi:MAG: hypothetical protein D6690_07055 [Nitrospirae bacterium]|nr:MAG: hypothetical protein D6690_07055 [Nitrospirota bacterium]
MTVFRDNLRILGKTNPRIAQAVEASKGGWLTIEQAKNGTPTARLGDRWIHSAYDPQQEASCWADQQREAIQSSDTILVWGIGLLHHVKAFNRGLPEHVRCFVPVPSLDEWRDALSAIPLEGWGERIHWCHGSPEDVAKHILDRMSPSQSLHIVRYEPAAVLHREFYATLEDELRTALARQQSGRLNIVVVGPIYGGSLPVAHYTVRALKALGHQVQWIDHSLYERGYHSLDVFRDPALSLAMKSRLTDTLGVITLAHVAEQKPDLVLALAQAPLSLPVLEQLHRKKFLTAMWFVENFRIRTYWQQVAAGYDFWFVMQQGPCFEALARAGARHVKYLPLAADPTIHRPLVLSDEELKEFGADVAFVGAGYTNRRMIFPRLLNRGWRFKIWGNEWDDPADLKAVIQRQGARIDTETCVKIFNATSVNLNIHSYVQEGFDPEGDGVNPRTFELAACGAFQLVDHRILLPELFEDGMLAQLRRPDDLVKEINRYLHEPELRQTMAAQARAHVLAHHTYEHRMKTMLTEIGLHTPDRIGEILRGGRSPQALMAKSAVTPELQPLFQACSGLPRVELEDLAEAIKRKGPTAQLSREELLILMMDAYRQETRDLV